MAMRSTPDRNHAAAVPAAPAAETTPTPPPGAAAPCAPRPRTTPPAGCATRPARTTRQVRVHWGALGGGQCSARRPLFGKHRAQLGRLAVDAVGVLVEEGVAVEPRGGQGRLEDEGTPPRLAGDRRGRRRWEGGDMNQLGTPVVRARLGRDRWPARLRGPSETGARAHLEDGCLRAPTRSSRVLCRLSNSRTSGGDPRSPADWNGAPSPRGGGACGASRTSPDSDLPPRRPRGGRTAASPVQLRRGAVVRFATLDAPTTTMVKSRRYEGCGFVGGGISGQRAKAWRCVSREELVEFTDCRIAVGRPPGEGRGLGLL